MKTKSGKNHYKCEVRKYKADGALDYENNDFVFVAFDAVDHLEKLRKSYANHGMNFEYKNLINLDE